MPLARNSSEEGFQASCSGVVSASQFHVDILINVSDSVTAHPSSKWSTVRRKRPISADRHGECRYVGECREPRGARSRRWRLSIHRRLSVFLNVHGQLAHAPCNDARCRFSVILRATRNATMPPRRRPPSRAGIREDDVKNASMAGHAT